MHTNPASSVLAAKNPEFPCAGVSEKFSRQPLNSNSPCLYIVGSALCTDRQKPEVLPFLLTFYSLICLLLKLFIFSNNLMLVFSRIQTATPKK